MSLIARVHKFIDRPWYIPLISVFAALDIFVLFFPTDGFLITASAMKPKKWISNFIWVTTGSALGALAMGFVIQFFGDSIITRTVGDHISPATWDKTTEFIEHHGIWALAVIALGPFPLQPGVIIAALAKMPPLPLFLSVWVGRAIKYGFFSWAASHAPGLLRRFWLVKKEVRDGIIPP